jgi:hypothetical protein
VGATGGCARRSEEKSALEMSLFIAYLRKRLSPFEPWIFTWQVVQFW